MKWSEINLGVWNVYFIFKLILFINGGIEFNFLQNLAFIAFLFLPTRNKFLNVTKQLSAISVGVYLFYSDSYLPPFSRLLAQTEQLSNFSTSYLIELATRFVSVNFVLTLFIISVFYFMFHKIIRISVLVTGAVLYLQLSNSNLKLPAANQSIETIATETKTIDSTKVNLAEQITSYKNTFFSQQADLKLPINIELAAKSNFDILVLSVCSLAWDDVKYFHQENHKLFKEFDIIFDHFNSVSSYSGPTVIRLLQANCGQKPHADLLANPSNKQCYLLENLKSIGFDTALILNHDGVFDNFLSLIKEKGGMEAEPMKYKLNPYLLSFDGSYIYRDIDVISQWLTQQETSSAHKKITFYNTISLHDGVRFEKEKQSKASETYERRLITLLDDMYAILEGLKKSNRPIVVLFVPEHGANIRGDKVQIAGMRELPSPAITNVPVGLKIIGNNLQRVGEQKRVTQPSSFLAIAHLVNQLLEQNIFSQNQFEPEKFLNNLPETPMVSENEGSTVIQYNKNYYYSFNDNKWIKYDE